MSAVMVEIYEPEGLGHELLLEWAPWARDDKDGERHSWSVKPRVDPGYHGDPPANFWIVDKIVAPQRKDKTVFWRVVSAYYLGERAPWEIAKALDWSEHRVLINLNHFAALVEREWRDYTTTRRVRLLRAR